MNTQTEKIDFSIETIESLNEKGITQMDFLRDFVGTEVIAELIKDNNTNKDSNYYIYELHGAEVRYALLTNGDTYYTNNLEEIYEDLQ